MISRLLTRPAMKVCRLKPSFGSYSTGLFRAPLLRSFGSCTETDAEAKSDGKKHPGAIYKPGTIVQLSKPEELDKYLAQKDKYVVVSFFKEGCEGCKKVIPRFQQRAAKVTKDFNIVKIDLPKYPDLAKKYGVQAPPHAFLYKNGKVQATFKGDNITDAELDTFFKPLMS